MFDVAIVGAGPAGATLARLIGKTHKVLLIDKRELDIEQRDNSVVKCCGGLVAPDAQQVLAELGMGLPRDVLVGPQLFSVRTIDLNSSIERYYQRFYINIDREKFDRWLISLIPSCVDSRFGCVFKDIEVGEQGAVIKFTQDGKEFREHARFVVGADGAFSMIRRMISYKSSLPPRYISIQEWYEVDDVLPYFSAIFDDDTTDFYSWTIPKENSLLIGSALKLGDDVSTKFETLKKKLLEYGYRFDKKVKREGAFILRPQSMKHTFTGRGRIALLGEAAGWISPSSAEGLSYAFRSAVALAQSLVSITDTTLEDYRKRTEGIRMNILIKNLKSPFMYNPHIRKIVMATGIQSLKHKNCI